MPYKDPEKRREYHREYERGWRARNPEKVKEKFARWREKNLEYDQERSRAYRADNLEAVRTTDRELKRRLRTDPDYNAAQREYKKRWRHANPEKVRDRSRRTRYKLKAGEYEQMIADQENRCAACGDEMLPTPHIDHCHKTQVVRGLLCPSCNVALGHLRDDPERVAKLLAYIERHAEETTQALF